MKRLIIIGAGGFGREVCAWAKQSPQCGKDWQIQGFLDDNTDALSNFNPPLPVIDSIQNYSIQSDDLFLCAIGSPHSKKTVCTKILQKGGQFLSLIHPSLIKGDNVTIGTGVIICPGVILTSNIVIKDFATINCGSTVGHDVSIGNWSTLSALCDVTGGCSLDDSVFVGSHSSIIPGKHLKEGAFIGAGSVVISDVAAGNTVFGSPARIMKR